MGLKAVHSAAGIELWRVFTERSLTDAANTGAPQHDAHIWLTHRIQRDLLLERAAAAGHNGWLNPPISFLSGLPKQFAIEGKPIGLLARRHLLAMLAATHGRQYGMPASASDTALVRSHMLDAFFAELLPEDVAPDLLANQLQKAAADDFARRRNAWIASVYRDYLSSLEQAGVYDPRQIHALVARRIDQGNLVRAINGAHSLHIYGLYSARSRRRLLRSLAEQTEVEVCMYTSGDTGDWTGLTDRLEIVDAELTEPRVQPAPDTHRELQWVAARVKELIQSGYAEAHEIAVVARTGLDDTRRALHVLEDAAIPATARVRTPLAEIGALKAMLDLFRAAAENWSYRSLRAVLASPYFGFRLDLRPFDRIAGDARPASLEEWRAELQQLLKAVKQGEDADARRMGIFADRLARDVKRFDHVCAIVSRVDGAKPLGEWLKLARAVLSDSWFRIRQRICRAPADRQDIVRLDQRGVHQAEALIAEWSAIEELDDVLTPADWNRTLRALLEKQELVLTTPGQKGVQVLEAHDAALAPFRATFVIHANDGEFPRSAAVAGLFTEEERAQLRAAGLPIDDRESVLQRERALWNAVASGAPRVFMSYRTTDPRGTPLLPSLLVPPHDREQELPRSAEIMGDPLNLEQARRRAAELLGQRVRDNGRAVKPQSVEPDALRHAILMAHAEQLRGAPERLKLTQPLNRWNGQLTDPWVLQRLADKFNHEYTWSASQLQSYAECPFFFFLNRVLRLEELEEAEEETSLLTFGGVAHDVLQRFYDEAKSALPLSLNDDAAARLERVAAQVFKEREDDREWLGSPVIWKQKKRQIREVLREFLTWDLAQLAKKKQVPQYCERLLGGAAGALIVTGRDAQGRTIKLRLAGRVDRVDLEKNGDYLVIDYKTTTTPSRGFEDGAILQGPLYMEALRQQTSEPLKVQRAVYRSLRNLKNGGEVKAGDVKSTQALRAAFSIPARVREGLFEAHLAASQKQEWKNWQPGLDVRRTSAGLVDGTRFDVE